MGQISKTTNPTGLKKVDRKHFIVRTRREGSGENIFWLEAFDYAATGLPASAEVGCIAHAGSTEEYFPLGAVTDFNRKPQSIRGLARDRPLKFRFIFHNPGQALLLGYADGVRAVDESGNLGNSLVDIEPTDLNGVAWKLVLPESLQDVGGKPNVLVERTLFPTAQSAARSSWFGLLVMPEVMRQIALAIASDPAALEDPGAWPFSWSEFLTKLGVELPAEDLGDDEDAQGAWVEIVVEKFSARGVLRRDMEQARADMDGE